MKKTRMEPYPLGHELLPWLPHLVLDDEPHVEPRRDRTMAAALSMPFWRAAIITCASSGVPALFSGGWGSGSWLGPRRFNWRLAAAAAETAWRKGARARDEMENLPFRKARRTCTCPSLACPKGRDTEEKVVLSGKYCACSPRPSTEMCNRASFQVYARRCLPRRMHWCWRRNPSSHPKSAARSARDPDLAQAARRRPVAAASTALEPPRAPQSSVPRPPARSKRHRPGPPPSSKK